MRWKRGHELPATFPARWAARLVAQGPTVRSSSFLRLAGLHAAETHYRQNRIQPPPCINMSFDLPRVSGITVEDPLRDVRAMRCLPVVFEGSDASVVPDGVKDWAFFDGAMLSLVVITEAGYMAMGTIVMIAPGLAITATHVVREHLGDLKKGNVQASCVGPSKAGLELWNVRAVSFDETSDIAYLSLERASQIPEGWSIRTIPITTRAPKGGERLHIFGFRMSTHATDADFGLTGNLFAASGLVTAVHHPIRDAVLMPFPTIEIACGALGGMSGGAVLDDKGHLVGVVSTSLGTEDGQGPTYAAWVVGAMGRKVHITWPPGIYPPSVRIVDIDQRLLHIEGREKVQTTGPDSYACEIWFDR